LSVTARRAVAPRAIAQPEQPLEHRFMVYGAKSVYPELDLSQILTDKALALYNPY
jgi:hypothetical protein